MKPQKQPYQIFNKIKLSPHEPDLYFNLAEWFLRSQKLTSALQACLKGMEYRGDASQELLHWGTLIAESGGVKESCDLYRHALALSPNQPKIYQKLAQNLRKLGDEEEATALERIAHSLESSGKVNPVRSCFQLTDFEFFKYLEKLNQDGVVVIPNYYTPDYCKSLRSRLEKIIDNNPHNIDFDNGAYLIHNRLNNSKTDRGVSRIYHANRLLPELNNHRKDLLIHKLITAYAGRPMYSKNLWYQYNQSSEETRYFHVDLFALRSQIKSIVYLQDTTLEDGPFCYIKGSHRNSELIKTKFYSTNPPGQDSGYTSDDLQAIISQATPMEAKAGSLILADVGGAHRGLPQRSHSRSILMQYFMDRPGDIEDGKT
jgi:tetratricopeptide (TPR) repeat protein